MRAIRACYPNHEKKCRIVVLSIADMGTITPQPRSIFLKCMRNGCETVEQTPSKCDGKLVTDYCEQFGQAVAHCTLGAFNFPENDFTEPIQSAKPPLPKCNSKLVTDYCEKFVQAVAHCTPCQLLSSFGENKAGRNVLSHLMSSKEFNSVGWSGLIEVFKHINDSAEIAN
ncbi:hypothetical protein CEXT_633901 [Caerostris extrusa]|uniref:Uncharacterized protein n=1 Tax=Caerostris extrusa TaxID=172846 RepID=A0AAV4UV19_CAEEX|nr:hypothetical protein CEXT_633901 [Caerostris extrusa]